MRVTLVKPPEKSSLNFGTFSLAVLAAAVRDICDITIVDATFLDVEAALKKVMSSRPDFVGVTTMGLMSVKAASHFIQGLRNAFSGLIIAGGHGATMAPRPLLEAGADAIVCGEGEETFREILLKGIADIKGLALLRDGHLVRTPPRPLISHLDSLKEPARDLGGPPPEGIALIETSRGCPYQCLFCEASRFYYGVWRPRSPERVAQDIHHLVQDGAHIIHIVDDNFTVNPERVLKICELLEKGPLPLFFYFSARSDDLLAAPGLIPALARAHFFRVGIGVETLEPELAHFIRKPIQFEEHQKACSSLKEAGIFTVASFITGLPGETEEMRRQSVDLAIRIGVDAAQFVPFQPLPGTPLEKGSGEPEPWAEEAAARLTQEFRNHPAVISQLVEAGKHLTVRGMLARATLAKWLKEGVLGADAEIVAQELKKIDPGLFKPLTG